MWKFGAFSFIGTRFLNSNSAILMEIQTMRVTKLCNTKEIVTVNNMFPGPVVYAQEDDRIIIKVTNQSPYNATIHWHGVRQRLSCWFDGPSYITQCPIQPGQAFTYEFTMFQQKGTFFWHAHVSWLRGTVYGALIVYPKTGVPYPFKYPYEEHIIILGEYWLQDVVQLERQVIASGGPPPPANAFTINGHPGPNYNCSGNDVYKIDVVPGKTYLLRLINAGLNMENFFSIANHKLTIVEADAEYTKPFTTTRVMLGPGQTINVLVTADQPIGKYSMAMGPYMSAQGVAFQNISAIAYLQYLGALPNSLSLPAQSKTPQNNCQGVNNGVMAASMNNISFVKPNISVLEAFYKKIDGFYTDDFPGAPLKFYDFVNGAPNNIPNNTNAANGTRVKVLEYGSRVQIILQDTGTLTTENHPIHLHGYSFYVIGYGTGNYNPQTANFNLVDPPYMNTIGVPVGGWAAIRFTADNPGVWFLHCHIEIHLSWGLGTVLIVKNGIGELERLPHPPADLPRC
ncbi:hypothetical protein LWI29_033079 [Acer saccharum]|uniref:laccase n=1 Tax=Acer saccharum TaxID=4024 RepID=A0AA39VM51_ACESA|nr:hypothetical protein LWI29_033079 [Acer saccharum]